MLAKIKHTYHEFPRNFWILVGAAFIDRLGGGLVFPFFAVYITQRFNVGMTQVGQLFALFSVTGMIGGVLGGAMADKFGRKKNDDLRSGFQRYHHVAVWPGQHIDAFVAGQRNRRPAG